MYSRFNVIILIIKYWERYTFIVMVYTGNKIPREIEFHSNVIILRINTES